MIDSEVYVKRALSLTGVKYKHLGRNRRGIDCLGVLMYTYEIDEGNVEEIEIVRKKVGAYFSESKWRMNNSDQKHIECVKILKSAIEKRFTNVERKDIRPGDLMLMAFKSKNKEFGDHVAIYVGEDEIIHADLKSGVVMVKMERKYWNRVRGIFRYN